MNTPVKGLAFKIVPYSYFLSLKQAVYVDMEMGGGDSRNSFRLEQAGKIEGEK